MAPWIVAGRAGHDGRSIDPILATRVMTELFTPERDRGVVLSIRILGLLPSNLRPFRGHQVLSPTLLEIIRIEEVSQMMPHPILVPAGGELLFFQGRFRRRLMSRSHTGLR